MRLTTFYIHAPTQADASPGFVPISGEFESVDEARELAIATATTNPRFTGWCASFEIENDGGQVVSRWSQGDADLT